MKFWASLHSRAHFEIAIRYVFSVLPFCLPKLDPRVFRDLAVAGFRRGGPPLPILGDGCTTNSLLGCPTEALRRTTNAILAEALIMSESADLLYEVADLLQECMRSPGRVSTFFEMLYVVLSRCEKLREFAAISDFPQSLERCLTVHYPKFLQGKSRKAKTDAWQSLDLTHLFRVIVMFPLSPALRTFALQQIWIEWVLYSKTDVNAFAMFWQAFGDRDLICAQLSEFAEDSESESDQARPIARLIELVSADPSV
jgi:hypothetical protein